MFHWRKNDVGLSLLCCHCVEHVDRLECGPVLSSETEAHQQCTQMTTEGNRTNQCHAAITPPAEYLVKWWNQMEVITGLLRETNDTPMVVGYICSTSEAGRYPSPHKTDVSPLPPFLLIPPWRTPMRLVGSRYKIIRSLQIPVLHLPVFRKC